MIRNGIGGIKLKTSYGQCAGATLHTYHLIIIVKMHRYDRGSISRINTIRRIADNEIYLNITYKNRITSVPLFSMYIIGTCINDALKNTHVLNTIHYFRNYMKTTSTATFIYLFIYSKRDRPLTLI